MDAKLSDKESAELAEGIRAMLIAELDRLPPHDHHISIEIRVPDSVRGEPVRFMVRRYRINGESWSFGVEFAGGAVLSGNPFPYSSHLPEAKPLDSSA